MTTATADPRPPSTEEMRREAERLERDNPRWIILFGIYTRELVAFPRFPVPRGTIVAARHPDALPARLRAVEQCARQCAGQEAAWQQASETGAGLR